MNLSELSFDDLQRLRSVVKRVRMRYYPPESYTDREADRIIEAIGEETAQKMLKALVDGRFGLQ